MSLDLLEKPDLDKDQRKDDDELGWLESNYAAPSSTESGSSKLQEKQEAMAQKELDSVKELDGKKSDKEVASSGANEDEPKWYTGKGAKKKKKGWLTKKKAATIAGLTASAVGFSAMFLGPMMGPLEFIHLAESVRLPHFGAQEDAGDIRLNALLRYAKKRAAGETRLTYLESKYFSRITADMQRAGFKARFDPISSNYMGMYVDTLSEKSPYRGLNNDEVKAKLEQKYGSKAFQVRDGRFYLQEGKSGFLQQYKTLRLVSKEMGYSGLTAAMRARVLSKYGVVTWNPLKKIDKAANQKLADLYRTWKKARDAKIRNGYKTSVVTAGAQDKDSDGKTKPVEGAGTVDGDAEKSKVKSVLDGAKNSKSLSAAGGLAAVAAVVCTAKAINDQAGEIKYLQIAEPLMREGTEALAAGSQVASGLATNDSFNDTQLDVMSRLLHGKDANGNTTSWDQAESIRANNGGSGGVPLDQATTEALANVKIPYLSWTEEPGIVGLCGNVGVAVTTTVSVAITVVSGGFASAAVGIIAGPYFTDLVIGKVSSLVAGEAVDLTHLGASYGARVDMGNKLAADFAGMQSAGEVMSTAETTALNEVVIDADKEEFARLPLKDRLFAVSERRSLAGRLIDLYPKSGDATMNSFASLFTGTLSRLASGVGSLSPSASAQSLKYNYGMPKFGFTLEELADERFADPYENDRLAKDLFVGPQGAKYIERAMTCYGVAITNTPEGWSAISQQNAYKEYFKAGERKSECMDRTDVNWMRTRNFVFNTTTMDSYACLQGEAQSCVNSGFGSGSAPAAPVAATGSMVNIADLSKESVSVACAAGTKDLGIQDGYADGALVKIRICAIPGMKNTGSSRFPGDDGNVAVNSRLSGAWFELTKKAASEGIILAATSGYRTYAKQADMFNGDSRRVARPGYSNHQMGLAVDIAGIQGVNVEAQTCAQRVMALDNPTWQWLNKNTAVYGIKQYSAEAWHWDPNPGGLSNRCGGDGTLRS
jgi:hypothetical protein